MVITIIVLLILAGVSIATLVGDNGILSRAKTAREKNTEAEVEEKDRLSSYEEAMDNWNTRSEVSKDETIIALGKKIEALEVANSYSTEEKIVGTWIDTKPIYQRSFENISFSGSSVVTIYTFPTGDEIDNIINGWFQRQTYNGLTSNNAKSSIPLNLFSSNGTTNLSGYVSGASGVSTGTITIQYTKVSDIVATD